MMSSTPELILVPPNFNPPLERGDTVEPFRPRAVSAGTSVSQSMPLQRLRAAIRTNKFLRMKVEHTEQCQHHERQVQSENAALPFVTTGVLNCSLIANNFDDFVDCIDMQGDFMQSAWDARKVVLMIVILVLLLVQFAIIGVLSYLFFLGNVATTTNEEFAENGIDKEKYEAESRRIRKVKNHLHATMMILALNASVLEVVYLTLAKRFG